jgi:predicted DNA binding protein
VTRRNGSIITSIAVPAEDFVLGSAITPVAGGRIRLERIVPVDRALIPYIRATEGVEGTLETALREESAVESYAVVDSTGDEILIRVEWSAHVDGFLDAIAESGATVLEGVGENDVWQFRLRFDDRRDLAACYRTCVDRDVRVDVEFVHGSDTGSDASAASALTDVQRETLRTAFAEGYFEVPRRTTIADLADEAGVSDTALSQRLRRGISRLLTATLGGDERPDSAEQ